MHVRQMGHGVGPDGPSLPTFRGGNLRLERQVQTGLNLFLRLKSPAQMPALLKSVGPLMPVAQQALRNLHYVHFARFLPSQDGSTLMVITVFDGDPSPETFEDSLRSYLMDFVAELGDIFTAILEFIQDAPRLPVQQYPRDFVDFVVKNSFGPDLAQPWSAYPETTVIEIQKARRYF